MIDFGTPSARPLGRVTVAELREHAAAGQFARGSMGPKVEAALRFVERGRHPRRHHVPRAHRRRRRWRRRRHRPHRLTHVRKRNPVPAPIEVRKVPLHNVSDASELAKLIDDGVIEADRVIAVIGKTEGNGGINDYTRIIADRAFREVLLEKGSRPLEEVKQIPIVWSGGTDGVISPHATIFATLPEDTVEKTDEPRLTVGYAMSDVLLPEDIGRDLDGREGRRGREAGRWRPPASPTRPTSTTCRPRRRC